MNVLLLLTNFYYGLFSGEFSHFSDFNSSLKLAFDWINRELLILCGNFRGCSNPSDIVAILLFFHLTPMFLSLLLHPIYHCRFIIDDLILL